MLTHTFLLGCTAVFGTARSHLATDGIPLAGSFSSFHVRERSLNSFRGRELRGRHVAPLPLLVLLLLASSALFPSFLSSPLVFFLRSFSSFRLFRSRRKISREREREFRMYGGTNGRENQRGWIWFERKFVERRAKWRASETRFLQKVGKLVRIATLSHRRYRAR